MAVSSNTNAEHVGRTGFVGAVDPRRSRPGTQFQGYAGAGEGRLR